MSKSTLRKIGIGLGIAAGLFVLLIVGGWAFVTGIGLLLGYAYTRTSNRGLLIAAGTMIGLGIGLGLELVLAREGGVAILAGVGAGLLGLTLVEWLRNKKLLWWGLIGGIVALAASAALWSAERTELRLFLTVFPFVIVVLLAVAGFEFWRGRKTQTA